MVIEIVKDGETKYFHTAWVSSYDGNDFSLQNFDAAMYVGKLTNDNPEEELDFHAYNWYLIVPGTSASSEELAREIEDIRSDFENSNSDIVGNMASVEEQTDEAKKVATDYIEDDGTTASFGGGFESIIIGNPSGGNIQIDADSVDIRDNEDVLGSFFADPTEGRGMRVVSADGRRMAEYRERRMQIHQYDSLGNEEKAVQLTPTGLIFGDYTSGTFRVNSYLNNGALGASIDSCFEVSTETLISSQNIAAEGYVDGTKSISKPGYYPVAISGWNSSTRYFALTRAYLSAASSGSGTISYMVSNHHSSAHSASMTVYVLWVKSA